MKTEMKGERKGSIWGIKITIGRRYIKNGPNPAIRKKYGGSKSIDRERKRKEQRQGMPPLEVSKQERKKEAGI